MSVNWPPNSPYPAWPPKEANSSHLSFATLTDAINWALKKGFTRRKPTPDEDQAYFRQVRCDHNDVCAGVMIISPDGLRAYPIAYCTGANHKAGMGLWNIGSEAEPRYDMGWGSGDIVV